MNRNMDALEHPRWTTEELAMFLVAFAVQNGMTDIRLTEEDFNKTVGLSYDLKFQADPAFVGIKIKEITDAS